MSSKTLADLRTSVRALYGDIDAITASDIEVDLFLKDGVNVVLSRCPWLFVPAPAVVALTTDAVGSANFATENIGNPHLVEMRQVDAVNYKLLVPGHPGDFANPENLIGLTSNDAAEYYLDGNRITFYPLLKSLAVTIRLTYSSNSIGASFPVAGGSSLPNSIPVQAEEAAILYAVMRLQQRDDNLPASEFLKLDFEGRIMLLIQEHNRPQRGTVLKPFQTDFYMLDADSNAW